MNKFLIVLMLVIPTSGACAQLEPGEPWKPSGTEWVDAWWSWLHWWEANRHVYLGHEDDERDREARPVRRQTAPPEVVAALVEATRAKSPQVRAAAALALGRTGAQTQTDRLVQLVSDSSRDVRQAAWLALAMIGGDQARDFLLQAHQGLGEDETIGWLVGIALMDDPSDSVYDNVRRLLTQSRSVDVREMAVWLIRHRRPAGYLPLMRKIVRESPDAQAVSQAVLALGEHADPEDVKLLSNLYHQSGDWHRNPALSEAWGRYTGPGWIMAWQWVDAVGIRTAAGIALGHYRGDFDRRKPSLAVRALNRAYKMIQVGQYQKRYRLDLGWIHQGPGSDAGQLNDPAHLELRVGLISLGRVGRLNEAELLAEVMEGRHELLHGRRRPTVVDHGAFSPSRGFAALGLGVLLRRWHEAAQAGVRPNEYERVRRRMTRRLRAIIADDENPSVRAAALTALGISGDEKNIETLRETARDWSKDATLAGYGIMALGMLGAPDTAALAGRYLGHPLPKTRPGQPQTDPFQDAEPRPAIDMDQEWSLLQTLGRRAAIIGVNQVADRSARWVLLNEFGHNRILTMEMMAGLRRSGDDLATPLLVDALGEQHSPDHRAFAAWCLGERFASEDISPLTRVLLTKEDFTRPNPKVNGLEQMKLRSAIYRLRLHAHDFLYRVLVPYKPNSMVRY